MGLLTPQSTPGSSKKGKDSPPSEAGVTPESRYETFLKVKVNRQTRLGARSGKSKRKKAEEAACPVCSRKITGSSDELHEHVEQCLRKQSVVSDDELLDVEGEGFEEYEWAGQTRVRATSMVDGKLTDLGFHSSLKASEAETDADLNVDGDDDAIYGRPQYGEGDVIPCAAEPGEAQAQQALRGAVVGEEASSQQPHPTRNRWASVYEESTSSPPATDSQQPSCSTAPSTVKIIESLKAKLREQEELLKQGDKYKCLICMEQFTTPVVSVQCWHTHCEECWLRTMGAKKLCPQCNVITSPQDLRRIYL
ncbi:PREDICTED: E3 ubiquitin-protein ligase RNF220-like [Priapulus caudatus]|uniref:E3 ubiquitin-protein ligase RNF220-like n=1 Tax=Priapulus caudatus TaxID=37621 RepID=A0ABM1EAX7_PRICU|nr:PREDICTED: E3 ubiquitin-protein ligase RNF220-like [Priapulus caudatus]